MANKRISELTSITGANLADADLLVVVDVSDTTMASSGTNKKITMAELAKDSALTDNLIAKTTLTTDGDVLTRAAGVPDRITRADLAQDSAFSSRYVSKTEEEYRWVTGGAWVAGTGSPTTGNVANDNYGLGYCWLLDGTGAEGLAASVILPDYWATFHADLYWVNTTTNAGDIRIALYREFNGDGDVVDVTGITGSAITFSAPTVKGEMQVSRMASSIPATAGKILNLSLVRFPADAADTLANDIGIHGVLFTRAS